MTIDTDKRFGTMFQFVFRGNTFTGLHKFTDKRLVDSIARRLTKHLGHAVEIGYGSRTESHEIYEVRWFDGDVFHIEEVRTERA